MESVSSDIASPRGKRIRFVTCPTCREILPELPETPLYKCGRCATVLQAKNCKIGRSVAENYPMKKHGNSCRSTGKDIINDFVVDPCSTSESADRNEKYPAEEEHTKGDESMYLPRENNRKNHNDFPGQILEYCPNTENARGIASITVVEGHKVERSSMREKDYHVIDENNATRLEGSLNLEERDATKAVLGTLNPSMLTESLPQDDRYFKQNQKKLHSFGPPDSEDILQSLSSKPRSPIGSISKLPAKICYACGARNFKGAEDVSANRPRLKNRPRFKEMQNGQLLIDHELTASSLMSKVKNDLISTGSDWKLSEVPEARKHDCFTRNKMREGNNDSDTHKMAYMTRRFKLPHDNAIPSSIRHNVCQQYPEPHLPNSTFYDDPDKTELLKRVYELEEMLNQTHISKRMQKRRSHARVLGEEKHIPRFYDNLASVRNTYANFKHSGHCGNHSQGLRHPHPPKISRAGFSGENTRCRDQMDCVCSHCCPQSWHHTTKSCSCIFSQHAMHPQNNYDYGYPSYSQSLQTHSNDKIFSQFLERKADKQLHKKKNVRKLCLREKYQNVRRHLLPVSGGAPIMACHYCSELLQLPAEHTVSNRRCYQLRCYSCERIMKLFLENKVHLVPYSPTISTPPPSEIDDYSHEKNGRIIASTYHSGNHQ